MGLSRQIIACAALAGLSVASPAPQQLDLAQISAAPSVASGPATSTVDLDGYQTASLFTSFTVTGGASASATASRTVTSVCTFTVPISTDAPYSPYYPALATSYTTDPALTGTTTSGQACPTTPEEGTYCGFINPNDPCAAQPDGYGPVPTPDTASAFREYSVFHSLATAAPTVVASQCNTQYQQVFRDLDGSVSAQSYMGQYTLQSYDVEYCAKKCDATSLCTSFNIYAERDPSLNPAKNDSTAFTVWGYWCPNPASMTTFRCTLWGSSIDGSLATNKGGWREDFEVVIAASNGYDRTNVTIPEDPTSPVVTSTVSSTISIPSSTSTSASSSTTSAGSTSTTSSTSSATSTSPAKPPTKPWGNGHNCGGKAINAGQYWMGSRYFPGPFNPQVCSDYALAQNAANANAAKNQGSASYSKCKMFNAVYYHKNGVPHGTYCSLYSTQLGDSWATYSGSKSSNGDKFDCKQSWTWTLAA
ncbi:hypothetical protein K431DRAFT_219735 [Polychaeton citri CBS 116435]|uniref:Apple domain-containing protein n=1 Tax=Polychaeton citri CBS 116435 TaxID=1314669 RepID=A0A9P4UR56_9PEZI|nr:hypothetical protein K431DRAFT_219735 [Polychaeton citri CBS 116435]